MNQSVRLQGLAGGFLGRPLGAFKDAGHVAYGVEHPLPDPTEPTSGKPRGGSREGETAEGRELLDRPRSETLARLSFLSAQIC